MIDKLKDPKKARPYGLLSKEEQAVMNKAGRTNVLWFDGWTWKDCGSGNASFVEKYTYILKPDYEPEFDYVKVLLHCKKFRCNLPGYGWTVVTYCPCIPTFDSFIFLSQGHECTVVPFDVSNRVHNGCEVFGKFRIE